MIPEPVVYFAQDPPPIYINNEAKTKDLSSAARYGRFEFILESNDRPSITPGPLFRKVKNGLKDFHPEHDYLCFAGGDPMALALALLELRDQNLKEIQFLQFNRERDTEGRRLPGGYYMPVTVPLRGYS